MNRESLIFDWSNAETHPGWKGASVLLAALGFVLFFSVFGVRFDLKQTAPMNRASVMVFSDFDAGHIWRMRAEEEGPFPGRLEISGLDAPLAVLGADSLIESDLWNSYELEMRPLHPEVAISSNRIAVQGQRVFPRSFKSAEVLTDAQPVELALRPILIPYTQGAEHWMPRSLPVFRANLAEKIASADWRFVLSLRADGSVHQCLSLSGGREESLLAMIGWLEGLRFMGSEEEERWLGLRVEFLNERSHGTEPE